MGSGLYAPRVLILVFHHFSQGVERRFLPTDSQEGNKVSAVRANYDDTEQPPAAHKCPTSVRIWQIHAAWQRKRQYLTSWTNAVF